MSKKINTRLAGKLFLYKNNLYRPSQNCSKNYGYGMRVDGDTHLGGDDVDEKIINWLARSLQFQFLLLYHRLQHKL